ncbi:hypothetical protein, partial [Herbaspirillum sp. B65]|uniref:hypothetical protein n=1 Tax=Herbaspirillum sp. B65 TaxID=137708 RepID=UPI001C27C31F
CRKSRHVLPVLQPFPARGARLWWRSRLKCTVFQPCGRRILSGNFQFSNYDNRFHNTKICCKAAWIAASRASYFYYIALGMGFSFPVCNAANTFRTALECSFCPHEVNKKTCQKEKT